MKMLMLDNVAVPFDRIERIFARPSRDDESIGRLAVDIRTPYPVNPRPRAFGPLKPIEQVRADLERIVVEMNEANE